MSFRLKAYALSSVVVTCSLGASSSARAQDAGAHPQPAATSTAAPVPVPAPTTATPAPTTPGPPAPAPVPTTTPPPDAIAPSAPGASPAKIQAAKDTEKVAELTPIVPSPKDATRPAFQLYSEVDLPVVGVGLVAALARLIQVNGPNCPMTGPMGAQTCDPNGINALDRLTAGWWSVPWATASDVGLYGILGGAAVLLALDEGPVDALNDAVVVAESALSATAFASILSIAAGRPRPFTYGTSAPLADRNSADASLSFISSHASVSFAVATATFVTERRLHPKSFMPFVVGIVGESIATFIGTARVMAGKHFITDAVGGAIIGISMGTLVPSLHSSPVKIIPVVSSTQGGVGISSTF